MSVSEGGPFLATTALEDFWDVSGRLVFLGPWCALHSRRESWSRLAPEVLPDVWVDPAAVDHAAEDARRLVGRLCDVLGEALGHMHGEEHDERYWRLVLGPWLIVYVPIVIDRLSTLRAALDRWPDLETLTLSPESFHTPSDTVDSIVLARTDAYNLQFYTRILAALGHAYPSRPAVIGAEPFFPKREESLLARASALIERRARVVLKASNLPHSVELRAGVATAGAVWPDVRPVVSPPDSLPDPELRRALEDLPLDGEGVLGSVIRSLIALDVPRAFVEDWRWISDASAVYPQRARTVLSCNAFYYDEPFKRWTAERVESGARLLGSQHGGNYGSLRVHLSEDHELSISDRYYTWGWTRDGANTKPMPATKLVGRPKLGVDPSRRGILFTATSEPRFLLQFPLTPWSIQRYLEWQQRFFAALPAQLVGEVRVRYHSLDAGWAIRDRIEEAHAVAVDGHASFTDALADARIYVCDHLATTFAEALSANKPTVLFWNPDDVPLRPEAEPYYAALREAGVLLDTPEKAAATLAEAYADVAQWWIEPARQEAVAAFCGRFALTSPSGAARWIGELRDVLK